MRSLKVSGIIHLFAVLHAAVALLCRVAGVHDELVIDAPTEEREEVAHILQTEMENAVQLSVPLVAEVHCGKNWYEAK